MSTRTSIEVGQWITDPSAPVDQPKLRHRQESWGTITVAGTQLRYKGNVAALRSMVQGVLAGRNPLTYPGGLGAFLGYLGAQLDNGYTWARDVTPQATPATPAADSTTTA